VPDFSLQTEAKSVASCNPQPTSPASPEGGWLVGSIYTNNFSSVQDLRDISKGSSVWQFGNSIFEGPASNGIQIFSTADYYNTIEDEVSSKIEAGFNTCITDY
jgi:lysophospholipase